MYTHNYAVLSPAKFNMTLFHFQMVHVLLLLPQTDPTFFSHLYLGPSLSVRRALDTVISFASLYLNCAPDETDRLTDIPAFLPRHYHIGSLHQSCMFLYPYRLFVFLFFFFFFFLSFSSFLLCLLFHSGLTDIVPALAFNMVSQYFPFCGRCFGI